MNNPFFDQARDGCKKAEKELSGAVKCLYIGPGEHGGGEEQVQVVHDLIAKTGRRHRGIARRTPPPMGRALQEAQGGRDPGADLGQRPAAEGQGAAHRLCRHAQLRDRRQPREAGRWRSSRRAARSASSPAAPRRPTTTSACRASATRSSGKSEQGVAGRPADRPERLEGSRRLPALHQRRLPASRCSRWRTSWASTRSSTPSCRPAASRSSCPQAYRAGRREVQGRGSTSGSLALVVADTLPVQIDLLKAGPVARARSASGRSRWATRRCSS